MRWAVLFLPECMTVLTRRETNGLLNFASLGIGRLDAWRRRDMRIGRYLLTRLCGRSSGSGGGRSGGFGAGFRTFDTILGAADASLFDTSGIETAADDVVSHAGQIFDT